MRRRVVVFLSLVIAIVLCVPSVPAFADGDGLNKFVTTDLLISAGANTTYCSPQFQYADSAFSSIDFDKFNDFTNLPLNPVNDPCVYVLSGNPQSTIFITMFDMSDYVGTYSAVCSDAGLTIRTTNTAEQMPQFQGHTYQFNVGTGVWSQAYSSGSFSFSRAQQSQIVLDKIEGQPDYQENPGGSNKPYCKVIYDTSSLYGYYTYASSVISNFFYSNADVYYSRNQFWEYHAARDTSIGSQITNNFNNAMFSGGDVLDSLTNYLGLGYYNGSEYIDEGGGSDEPSVESNENHLYLNNVDAGFCKPITQDDLSGAGGGYFYVSYNFDSWINSHHGDYYLEFVSLIGVDGVQYGRTQNLDLDMGGVNIMPFLNLSDNDEWTNNALLFVEYPEQLTSNFNYGYVYSMPYLKYIATDYQGVTNADKLGKFRVNDNTWSYGPARGTGNMINRLLLTPLGGQTYDISKMSFGDRLESLFESVNHNSFVIDVQFSLVDRVSGEKSGIYRKSFDLLNGVVNIQSNNIKDNTNPYIPTDNELALVDDNSNGGFLRSYGYGSNNQIVNFSTPDNIKLFIDNGFSQFLAWYETSADTAYVSNRFWSNMGIFEENPAIPLYRTYFGFLPEDFKSIIFGCAGIGIIGGAFCILRRRLH